MRQILIVTSVFLIAACSTHLKEIKLPIGIPHTPQRAEIKDSELPIKALTADSSNAAVMKAYVKTVLILKQKMNNCIGY